MNRNWYITAGILVVLFGGIAIAWLGMPEIKKKSQYTGAVIKTDQPLLGFPAGTTALSKKDANALAAWFPELGKHERPEGDGPRWDAMMEIDFLTADEPEIVLLEGRTIWKQPDSRSYLVQPGLYEYLKQIAKNHKK